MGMDTMRVHKPLLLSAPALLSLFSPAWAEVTITPSLSSAVYAYGIKDQTVDADRGMAYEVMPGINVNHSVDWLSSRLNIQSQNLVFNDAQRDDESYFNYDLNSNATFLSDALNITVGFNQQNRKVSESRDRYQDAISSLEELATVSSQRAAVSYENDRFDWAILDLSLNASRSRADGYIAEYQQEVSADTKLTNSVYAMSFGLATRDRNRKFFWGVDGEATKNERQVLKSQYNRRLYGVFGVPFFWRVSMIATGAVESNSELGTSNSIFSQYGNFHSLGGGLEWKITDRSWWNVTFNKVTDAKEDREYLGTEFHLTPSKRTTLSGSLDKRFFGRTARIDGSYKLKHLRMSVRVTDNVGSVLGLGNNNLESALFVCPPGVTPGLDNCFQPPTANYRPALGETYYNIADPTSDLSEFLVVRRDVSYQISYDFNRLKLAADIGQRKEQLIELNALNDNKFVNLSANWQLNRRNSLLLAMNYSDLIYEIDNQSLASDIAGAMKSVTLTFNREVNRSLSANLNLKRMTVDYDSGNPDYQENRIWVGFNYKF